MGKDPIYFVMTSISPGPEKWRGNLSPLVGENLNIDDVQDKFSEEDD